MGLLDILTRRKEKEEKKNILYDWLNLQKRGLESLGKVTSKVGEKLKFEPPKAKILGREVESPLQTAGRKLINLPADIVKSYGDTASKIGTGQKLGLEDYLNMADFTPLPIVGFAVGGVKPVRELTEKAVKEVGEKALKETGEKRLKHLITYHDKLKRMFDLSEAEADKIGYKEAKEIFEKLPQDLKERMAAKIPKTFEKAPLPIQELQYELGKRSVSVKNKVNILNYLSTPEYMLDKIGLTSEKKALRGAYDNYQRHLRSELQLVKSWVDRVPRKDSKRVIFNFLDGTIDEKALNKEELQIAKEMKTWFKNWADKLGLPEENRITNYITHIFEREKEGVEFPLEIAKKIQDKVAGSVYDPFLQKRYGKENFVEDAFRAAEAYAKRATRKVNLDPALSMLKEASEKLDPETYNYIKKYSHGINLRPTDLDKLTDNLIKQSPIGYKFTERPTAYLTNKWRQMIARGALGLNVGSAMRNLSQGVNTYAVLGEKYTLLGYTDMVKTFMLKDWDELIKHNVLLDDIVIDREMHATKKALQKVDDVLFSLFDFAERVNRGSAYFGAKRKALAKGMTPNDAIDYAKSIVRKTQFTFNAIDQPVALQGDLAKAFSQFLTYPIKQAEFLGGMVKDKNFVGLLRYTAAGLTLSATYGKLFGMGLKEFIPFSDARFTSPAGQTLKALGEATLGEGKKKEEGKKELSKLFSLLFPGGVQLKKSIQGTVSGARGYTATPTGRVRYPVGGTPLKGLQLLLFGQYAPQEAREYYGKGRSPLGEEQSKRFIKRGRTYYERVMREREAK